MCTDDNFSCFSGAVYLQIKEDEVFCRRDNFLIKGRQIATPSYIIDLLNKFNY